MTVQDLRADGLLTDADMSLLVINAMTATRGNIDALCTDPAFTQSVVDAAKVLSEALRAGGRVLACGNGGSLCDAMHFAEELTGNFRSHRRPLSALALSDSAHLTCVANDYSYDQVFVRGVEAHGRRGDVLVALSTSGKSLNILAAVASAKAKGMSTIGIVGHAGSPVAQASDVAVVTAGNSQWADRVQELHIMVIHTLIELIEAALFGQETVMNH